MMRRRTGSPASPQTSRRRDPHLSRHAPRRISSFRLLRLAALGFSTKGDKSDFQRRRRVTGPESPAEAADAIVRAFREVYDAGANENFTMIAPLVREPPPFGSYLDGICEDATS